MEHSDEWLAAQWAAGDKAAMARLVTRYYEPLLHLFYRLTGHRRDAEDLVQETWLRALRSLRERRELPVRPWLYRIATNLWRDEARKYVRRKARGIVLEPLTEELQVTGDGDIAERVVQSDLNERIRAALLKLSLSHQQVLLLRYYEKLPYEEIAQVAGVPVGTIRSRLHHATQHLKHHLRDLDEEGGLRHGEAAPER